MILFCGDPHGQFAPCLSKAEQARPENIVLLGDQTPDRPLKSLLGDWWPRTWFILGNHDTDAPEYLVCYRGDMWEHNLHARVQVLGGLRVADLAVSSEEVSGIQGGPTRQDQGPDARACPAGSAVS